MTPNAFAILIPWIKLPSLVHLGLRWALQPYGAPFSVVDGFLDHIPQLKHISIREGGSKSSMTQMFSPFRLVPTITTVTVFSSAMLTWYDEDFAAHFLDVIPASATSLVLSNCRVEDYGYGLQAMVTNGLQAGNRKPLQKLKLSLSGQLDCSTEEWLRSKVPEFSCEETNGT